MNWRQLAGNVVRPLLAVATALGLGFIVVWLSGLDPFEAYGVMLKHGFLTANSLQETLERTVPLTLTGLAVAMAFRGGVFNIGVEGQLYMGALAGFWVGWAFKLPGILHPIMCIAAGALAGAIWAYIPGIARVRWKADEIVSTIMLNYIAIQFTSYMVARPFKDTTAGTQQTWPIEVTARLFRFFENSRVHTGIFVAIGLAILLYYVLFRSSFGYEIRMIGQNPLFTEYGGINSGKVMLQTMMLSGALGGIAGVLEILGIHFRFVDKFSPGYGFDGVVIALMARNHPLGVILTAFLYGGFKTGSAYMDRLTSVPRELNDALQGILIFLIAAEGLYQFSKTDTPWGRKLAGWFKWRRRDRNEEVA